MAGGLAHGADHYQVIAAFPGAFDYFRHRTARLGDQFGVEVVFLDDLLSAPEGLKK